MTVKEKYSGLTMRLDLDGGYLSVGYVHDT